MLLKITNAESFPVTLDDLREYCRAPEDLSDDRTLLTVLRAAVDYVENHTSIVLAPSSFEYRQDDWGPISLPRSPVRDVLSLSYLAEDGVETDVLESLWSWELSPAGADLHHSNDYTFPILQPSRMGRVRVRFQAGYDNPAESGSGDDPHYILPETARVAVLMLASQWYDKREPSLTEPTHEVAFTVRNLLDQLRVYR